MLISYCWYQFWKQLKYFYYFQTYWALEHWLGIIQYESLFLDWETSILQYLVNKVLPCHSGSSQPVVGHVAMMLNLYILLCIHLFNIIELLICSKSWDYLEDHNAVFILVKLVVKQERQNDYALHIYEL